MSQLNSGTMKDTGPRGIFDLVTRIIIVALRKAF
jgi:hypothetical protein